MKILMLSSTFPYPPERGGTEVRTFNLLKYLAQRHSLTLVTQVVDGITQAEIVALRAHVHQLVTFPLQRATSIGNSPVGKVRRMIDALRQGTPPNVLYRFSPDMQRWVDGAIASNGFDAITCEHSVNEIYVRSPSPIPAVVNIHSSVYAWTKDAVASGASQQIWRDRLYLPLLYRYEQRYGRKFSEIVVTTPDDGHVLKRLCPNTPITIIPNGVDLAQFPMRDRDPGGQRLIYVGAMDASHNVDAARYFALQVFPAIRQRYPAAEFVIAGARPVPGILTLNHCPGVTVMGAVPQMAMALHSATVCVVPLRTGLGIKNKTLEAMAAGVPVVASDRGLEGLTVDENFSPLRALRANCPEEYIKAIGQLFEQPELRQQISQQARQYVECQFSWKQAGQAYEAVLARLTQPRA